MRNIKEQLNRKLGFEQEKMCFSCVFKRINAISFAIAILFVAFSFVPTVCLADTTPPTLVTEVWAPDDMTGTEIINEGAVSLENIDEVGEYLTIYSVAAEVGGSTLYNHKAQVKMGAGPWITLIDCWDTDANDYCDFMGDIRIADLKSDSLGDIAQLRIGPFNDGDIVSYRSLATDTASPVGNTGWSFEKVFRVTQSSGGIWIKSFSKGNLKEEGFDVIQVGDDFVIAGSHKASGSDSRRNFSITKLDKDGYVIWSREYGDNGTSGISRAMSIQQTSDGGYVIGGTTDVYGTGNYDLAVLKVDSFGFLQWIKIFNGDEIDWGFDIIQTSSNEYILVGSTESYGDVAGNSDGIIIKLDSNGNKLWAKRIGLLNDDLIWGIIETSTGDFVGVGDINGSSHYFKFDSNFNLVWSKQNTGESLSINETLDGGYILGGLFNNNFLITKIDINGNKAWEKIYGGPDDEKSFSVQQTIGGGYIGFGQTKSFGNGNYDIILFKLDSSGDVVWSKTFGTNDDEYFFSGKQASDGGYILVGWEDSVLLIHAMLVIKTDSDGNSEDCSMSNNASLISYGAGPSYSNGAPAISNILFSPIVLFPIISFESISLVNNLICSSSNTSPTVTTNPVPPINCCVHDLPGGVSLSWNFNDVEDGNTQTAYEIELTRSDGASCASGKQVSSVTSLVGTDINSFCLNFIDYGLYTYTWKINVYDSGDADSGFVDGISFPASPTPIHQYPVANFSYSADDDPPLQFQEITFDPLTSPDNSEAYGGASIVSFEWDFGDGTTPNPTSDPLVNGGVITHFYSEEGPFTIDLKVTDDTLPIGYSCWASEQSNAENFTIGENKSKWNETTP